MSRLERPSLKLKIELEVPDLSGGPSRRYMVSRALKARWDENSQNVTKQILEEIKNYKGSFIGDLMKTLNSVFYSKENLIDAEVTRENDVARWGAQLIDAVIFASLNDDSCIEYMENQSIPEWDGSIKDLDTISPEELKNIDIEKTMLLLSPKIKHVFTLLSKKLGQK